MDSILLVGAEAVQSAGSNMRQAADTMRQAGLNIDGSVDRLERILTTFAQDMASIAHRLEEVQRKFSIPFNLPGG